VILIQSFRPPLYDFAENKQKERETGFSFVYIALGSINGHIASKAFEITLPHKKKANIVKITLTSFFSGLNKT